MSAQDHLKRASAEIAKASVLVKQEADDLRKNDKELTKNSEASLASMTILMRQHESEMQQVDDPAYKSRNQSAITNLQRQMREQRQQAARERKEIEEAVRAREQLASQLEQQAKNIQP